MNKMSNLFNRILMTVLVIFAFASCRNDISDNEIQEPVPNREWYKLISIDTLGGKDMISSITDSHKIEDLPPALFNLLDTMVHTSFLYHSLNGQDTLTLSGSVCWPLDANTCSTIWLENHYTTTKWDECPSQIPTPGMIISSFNHAVFIGADYQGLGLSRDLPQAYFDTKLQAAQSIDCFKAGLTLLMDWGPVIKKDYDTYNMGYSLGGGVSMAIARQVTLEPELQTVMHLRKSFCGGGPYDQVALFTHFLENPAQELELPLEFPCAIMSMYISSQALKKYTMADIFSSKLINNEVLDKINTRNYTTGQINGIMESAGCSSLQDIFSPAVMDPDSQLRKDLIAETSKLDLTVGWTPRIPILCFHSEEDHTVPVQCLQSVKDNMPADANITYETIQEGKHGNTGVLFYMNLLLNHFTLN